MGEIVPVGISDSIKCVGDWMGLQDKIQGQSKIWFSCMRVCLCVCMYVSICLFMYDTPLFKILLVFTLRFLLPSDDITGRGQEEQKKPKDPTDTKK